MKNYDLKYGDSLLNSGLLPLLLKFHPPLTRDIGKLHMCKGAPPLACGTSVQSPLGGSASQVLSEWLQHVRVPTDREYIGCIVSDGLMSL